MLVNSQGSMTKTTGWKIEAEPLAYATRGEGGDWSGRAIRLAFFLCGLTSSISLVSAVVSTLGPVGSDGEEFGTGILAVQWMFAPANGSPLTNIEKQQLWPDILNLPVPLLLLVACLHSKRPRLASTIRVVRLLAAGLLIGVAVGEWLYISFDDEYVLSLRERAANAVRLTTLNYPLVPLLIMMGLWTTPARRVTAVAFGVVLACYAGSMCLSFRDMAYALFESSYHGGLGITPDYTGIARLCDSLYEWLVSGMDATGDFRDATPPLHTLLLLWTSAAGTLIAAGCFWSRRVWLRRIGAAALLPAVVVCMPGRLLPWFDVGIEWMAPGDDSRVHRLLSVGGYIEIASPTLQLTAFALAAIVTLLTRPTADHATDATSVACRRVTDDPKTDR